ncbi:MAG: hemolysin family protein [Eubacteriales bacterium]|nr:hemolysin family protein [Eubacteriales bacterium]
MIGAIFLQIVLIFLNAVFASAEIAVISMNETKLEKMAENGDKRAGRLVALTSNPAKFLATIQVAITLAGFLGSAYAADNFAEPLVALLQKTGIPVSASVLKSVCVFLITVIIAYFSIVFGELIPKRIAMQKKEEMALGLSGVLTVVSKIFAPLVWLLTASTNGVLTLLGIDPNQEDEVSEEEIRMMVAAGSEKGTIDREENEFIQNVFEFDDTDVDEICTHRMELELLEMEDSPEEWERQIQESRHSYYPVCGENSDDIIGILDAKIYLRMKDKTREKVMQEAVKKPYFVPESMKADVLFRNMKKTGNYFAVVIDEYGGMSGIITVRDLIEALVGDLYREEGREPLEEIRKIAEDEWMIQGCASLDDVAKALKKEFPVEEFDTFSGFICGKLEEIPGDGASFEMETDGLLIEVCRVKDRKVEEARVKCLA